MLGTAYIRIEVPFLKENVNNALEYSNNGRGRVLTDSDRMLPEVFADLAMNDIVNSIYTSKRLGGANIKTK